MLGVIFPTVIGVLYVFRLKGGVNIIIKIKGPQECSLNMLGIIGKVC